MAEPRRRGCTAVAAALQGSDDESLKDQRVHCSQSLVRRRAAYERGRLSL